MSNPSIKVGADVGQVTAGIQKVGAEADAAMPNSAVQMSGSHRFVVIAHPRLARVSAISNDGHYCPAVATSKVDITLGITRNVGGALPSRTANSSIPRIVASPDIPLWVRQSVGASFMTSVHPTGRLLRRHCLQPSHISFVTVMAITR